MEAIAQLLPQKATFWSFLFELCLFGLQVFFIVLGFLIVLSFLFSLSQKGKETTSLKVKSLNKKLSQYRKIIENHALDKKTVKKNVKSDKKVEKALIDRKTAYVLSFDGDIHASAVQKLREEVTAVLLTAKSSDQVVVKLKSPGGVVNGYGLAASQLARIKDAGIPLVACIDEVAASGGYMMASVANHIYSAPFAILGSIGVVASIPNFNRLLEKNNVDYLEMTAGEFKRTLTTMGKVTEQGKNKFQDQLESIHGLFKGHVTAHRPKVDIDKVATGEYWFGTQALGLGLVDELKTSDAYLIELSNDHNVLEVSHKEKTTLKEKIAEGFSTAGLKIVERFFANDPVKFL